MLDSPNDYKCDGCIYFKNQWIEQNINIDGTSRKITLWFPTCHLYLDSLYTSQSDNIHIATDKCKRFKKKN